MPKTPIDYTKCEMYKIVCKDEDLDYIYVGHTTNWTKRKYTHKNASLTYTNKLYQTIRENGGWNNFKMLLIETFSCNNKREAEAREAQLMTVLKANMNQNCPFRTKKQYNEANKEQILEQKKQYYEANKEEILEQQKQHYEANKEQIIERQKQYRDANKEQILERQKQYRDANKYRISARNREVYQADAEKIIERQKQYYKANKDRINARRRELYQAKKEQP